MNLAMLTAVFCCLFMKAPARKCLLYVLMVFRFLAHSLTPFRQDYKDPRRFPLVAPSCALLFLPFGLPVSFRCYGRVYLIPRLTLSSGKAVRSKLDCMHEPPFSPTAAPCPVTIILSPTRKDTTKRHWQQPLVTDLEELVLKLCAG